MNKRPELDTKNPPGQIIGTDYIRPPKYLKDVIKRIQRDEEPMKLPTPISGPVKALNDLKTALLGLCGAAEKGSKGEDGEQLRAMVLTSQIRRIIKENS